MGLLTISSALPAKAPAASSVDPDNPANRLGPLFSSKAAGVAFRPPAGGTMTRRMGVGTEIVQYANVEENWVLKVSRLYFDSPTRLIGRDDPATPQVNEAETRPGLLEQTVHQIKLQNAAAEILRKDKINLGAQDTGVVISRYVQGTQFWLRQQAIVEASDQLYFMFDLTTPSSRAAGDKPEVVEPTEQMAVEIFNSMLDTVKLLDWRDLLEENRLRLADTRLFLLNVPRRVEQKLVPEQFYRVTRDGKDVGWMYVNEMMGDYLNSHGIIAASVSQGLPEEAMRVDIATEAFTAIPRLFGVEAWMTISRIQKSGHETEITEVGQSSRRSTLGSAGNQPLREAEIHRLDVTQVAWSGSKAITRELPWYYLPQAVGTMIPRLVNPKEKARYLFASWVPAEREVILRYIDVEPVQEVTFNGKRMTVTVVRDRIGYEGEPVLHYISIDGEYLGNVNAGTGVAMIAADRATLARIWPKAAIDRPRLLEQIQKSRRSSPNPSQ